VARVRDSTGRIGKRKRAGKLPARKPTEIQPGENAIRVLLARGGFCDFEPPEKSLDELRELAGFSNCEFAGADGCQNGRQRRGRICCGMQYGQRQHCHPRASWRQNPIQAQTQCKDVAGERHFDSFAGERLRFAIEQYFRGDSRAVPRSLRLASRIPGFALLEWTAPRMLISRCICTGQRSDLTKLKTAICVGYPICGDQISIETIFGDVVTPYRYPHRIIKCFLSIIQSSIREELPLRWR